MADDQETTGGAPAPRLWRRALAAPEGKMLMAGVAFTCLYLLAVGLTSLWSGDVFHSLWTMTSMHIIGGRAAGLSLGYQLALPGWLIIGANMAIETFLVLLFYPLFVFSYNKLIVIEPLRETMERTQRAAEAHHKTVVKYGVPGLLLFVWFPFWMTGPVVGCVIGFLIGLRLWVNLTVVLCGTYLAIFCWGMILQGVHNRLKALGPYVPFVFVGFVFLVAVSIRIRYAFTKAARAQAARERALEDAEPD